MELPRNLSPKVNSHFRLSSMPNGTLRGAVRSSGSTSSISLSASRGKAAWVVMCQTASLPICPPFRGPHLVSIHVECVVDVERGQRTLGDMVELHRHVVGHALKLVLFQRHAALAAPRKVRPTTICCTKPSILGSQRRSPLPHPSQRPTSSGVQLTVGFITCRAGQQQEGTREVFAVEALEDNEVRKQLPGVRGGHFHDAQRTHLIQEPRRMRVHC